MGNDRYGNRRVPKMYAQINELRRVIANEGTGRIQEAWEKVEEHIDFAYQQNAQASFKAMVVSAQSPDVSSGSCSYAKQEIDDVEHRTLVPFTKAVAVIEVDTWNRSETAPRDGTEFLTFGRHGFAIVRWIDMFCADVETQRWFPVNDFSHWMPLLTPPVPNNSISPNALKGGMIDKRAIDR